MTPELMYLVWSAALTVVLVVIAVAGATQQVGLPTLAGNREGLPDMTGWAGRAQRAHRNMLESLVLFAILVFTAQIAGKTNAMTALGARSSSGAASRMRCSTSPAFRGCGPAPGSCRSSACS